MGAGQVVPLLVKEVNEIFVCYIIFVNFKKFYGQGEVFYTCKYTGRLLLQLDCLSIMMTQVGVNVTIYSCSCIQITSS